MCESYLRAISGEGTVVWQLKSLETSVETGPRSRVQFFRSFWNSTTFQTVPKVVFYDIYVIIYYVWIYNKILYVIYLFIISSCIYISQSLQWANTIYNIYICMYVYIYLDYCIYIILYIIYKYIYIYMRNNLIIIYYEFRRRLITLICLFLVKSILWYYAYVNAERRVTPAHRQALYKRRRSGARRAWN